VAYQLAYYKHLGLCSCYQPNTDHLYKILHIYTKTRCKHPPCPTTHPAFIRTGGPRGGRGILGLWGGSIILLQWNEAGAIHWVFEGILFEVEQAHLMTVTIELPSQLEADILAQAEAEGMPVSEYLQSLLSRQVSRRSGQSKLSPEEWIRRFEAWVASHSGTTVVLPDAAMELEAIYGDHGW
jgi:hypothetical protein